MFLHHTIYLLSVRTSSNKIIHISYFNHPEQIAEARKLCGWGYSWKIRSSPNTKASSFWTIHTNMFQTQSRIYFPQFSIAQYCTYRGLEFTTQNKSSPLKHTMAYGMPGIPANPGICLSPCPSIETHKPARSDEKSGELTWQAGNLACSIWDMNLHAWCNFLAMLVQRVAFFLIIWSSFSKLGVIQLVIFFQNNTNSLGFLQYPQNETTNVPIFSQTWSKDSTMDRSQEVEVWKVDTVDGRNPANHLTCM